MIHREINDLAEPMRPLVSGLVAKCAEEGITLFVFETLRDANVQAAYCAQGRESLERVNQLRELAGLYKLSEAENTKKITDPPPMGLCTVYKGVGHGNGTAVDVVPVKEGGGLWWNAPMSIWIKIGRIGESLGLVWGGRWRTWDGPHFQMPRK